MRSLVGAARCELCRAASSGASESAVLAARELFRNVKPGAPLVSSESASAFQPDPRWLSDTDFEKH